MTWLRDTIAGRTIIVLVLGLGTILGMSQFLYQAGIEREVRATTTASVADRLILVSESVLAVDVAKRDEVAHRMSGGTLELHWGREPLAVSGGLLDTTAEALRTELILRIPDILARGLVIGSNRMEGTSPGNGKALVDDHTTLLSLPMQDGSWLNATIASVQVTRPTSPSALLSAALGALGVVIVSILMGRWLTRPLEQLAVGARQLFATPLVEPLPESGTREVRTLAAAINDLQRRIRRLVDDRTMMLAAMSHDLRTPLTRLRLRTRAVADADARRSIEADLDEMEEMIKATLAFLQEDTSAEKLEPVDISAILETIAADAEDAGHSVKLSIGSDLVVLGRHLALKRALTNLIQNAIRYGEAAEVSAIRDTDGLLVTIRDAGPGIPADRLEAVFQPFYRLETSRGRMTGGYGLGLTVTRNIIRSHGGDVTLGNLRPQGLEARVTLPLQPSRS